MRDQIRGVFHAPGGRLFCAPGTKGGWGIKKREGGAPKHFLNSFVFSGLSLLFGLHRAGPQKTGRTIAPPPPPPPKRGFPAAPIAALRGSASIRPQGVAIVGIYPCGKARKRTTTAALRGGRKVLVWHPLSLASNDSRSVLAVKVRSAASRPGPLRADPGEAVVYEGKGGL